MKNYFKIIALSLFFCIPYLSGQKTTGNLPVPSDSAVFRTAMRNYLGINQPFNYERAYQMFGYLAKKNHPEAFNMLGIMYRDGTGVEKNYERAAKCFYLADINGSNDGTYNLAVAMRAGRGVKKNYAGAFFLFDKASKNGYSKGSYGAGDMSYKGLGTKQNYSKAMSYFEKGAVKGDKNCLYMLGICFLEGRGAKQNTKKSRQYFNEALKKGHSWVEDIVEQDMAGAKQRQKAQASKKKNSPRRRAANKAINADIEGKWNGTLTFYDWSGKETEQEIDLTLEITNYGDSAHINWIESTGEEYGFYIFKRKKAWTVRHLTPQGDNDRIKKVLRQIKFDKSIKKGQKTLSGNVLMASRYTRETLKPSGFKLTADVHEDTVIHMNEQENTAINISGQENTAVVSVFPNPFDSEIRVVLELREAERTSFEIYDINGRLVYSMPPLMVNSGLQTVSLNAQNLPAGNYILYIKGKTLVKSQLLIKSKE